MFSNIVDNIEQCGQQNTVQCYFHQARTGCSFFAVDSPALFLIARFGYASMLCKDSVQAVYQCMTVTVSDSS